MDQEQRKMSLETKIIQLLFRSTSVAATANGGDVL
jgi:hypothetical protein